MRCPSIVDVQEIIKSAAGNSAGVVTFAGKKVYVPARAQWSIDSPVTRLRAAWLVFSGRADAVTWPGQ